MQHQIMTLYSLLATSMPKLEAVIKVEANYMYRETWMRRDAKYWRKKYWQTYADLKLGTRWDPLSSYKRIYKRTWISPSGKNHNQIDHIIINGRQRHSPENVVVKRGADVGGDQQLLLTKVRLLLKETEKLKKDGTNLRFNIIKLKDSPRSKIFTTFNAQEQIPSTRRYR